MEEEKKKKVMLVEDDSSIVASLTEKLTAEGIKVPTAETGQQAVARIKSDPPDLVLLDIMLPGGMNGFDVLEQMKKDPALKSIPVIVLTNLDTEQKTALEIGAVDYVIKTNISIDEVVLKVKNLLK